MKNGRPDNKQWEMKSSRFKWLSLKWLALQIELKRTINVYTLACAPVYHKTLSRLLSSLVTSRCVDAASFIVWCSYPTSPSSSFFILFYFLLFAFILFLYSSQAYIIRSISVEMLKFIPFAWTYTYIPPWLVNLMYEYHCRSALFLFLTNLFSLVRLYIHKYPSRKKVTSFQPLHFHSNKR